MDRVRLRPIVTGIVVLGIMAGIARMCLPMSYSAESIEARVVDAESKTPLQGVLVTADWELVGGGMHPVPAGELQVLETVTDGEGRFRFPAWGPKRADSAWWYLGIHDPRLCLLKPDYAPRTVANAPRAERNKSSVRHSEWNGKAIELSRVSSSPEVRQQMLYNFARELDFAFAYETCDWQRIPQMLGAFLDACSSIDSAGSSRHLPTLDNFDSRARSKGCGSFKAYSRGDK